jgi:hypothetical protein
MLLALEKRTRARLTLRQADQGFARSLAAAASSGAAAAWAAVADQADSSVANRTTSNLFMNPF